MQRSTDGKSATQATERLGEMKMGKEQVRRRRLGGINRSAGKKKNNTPMGKCPGKARRRIEGHSYRAKFVFVASTLCHGVVSPTEKQPPTSCFQFSVEGENVAWSRSRFPGQNRRYRSKREISNPRMRRGRDLPIQRRHEEMRRAEEKRWKEGDGACSERDSMHLPTGHLPYRVLALPRHLGACGCSYPAHAPSPTTYLPASGTKGKVR